MTASAQRPLGALPSADQDAVSGLSIVNMLLRNRHVVTATALVLGLVVGLVLLLLPRTYTTESSFMLQSRSAIPSNISGLASQFGFTLPAGEPTQSPAFYAELLQSREILGAVVDHPIALQVSGVVREAPLADWLDVRGRSATIQRDNTIRELRKAVDVGVSVRTGVVTLRVKTKKPELSEHISARMLSWLNDFNLQKRQSQAASERQFTEARLDEARRELREAEDHLLVFTQRNRDTRNSPLLRLEEDRLNRDVLMRQQVYTSLLQAYDHAKIEEVRDTPVLTVLQMPETPVRPDPRGIVTKVILTLVIGVILGVWLGMARDALQASRVPYDSPRAEFDALTSELREDVRHPIATIGRLLGFGAASRRSTPPRTSGPL